MRSDRTRTRLCAVALLATACATFCTSCGPRMREQPAIQPYSRRMPPMPAGSVPTTGRLATLTDTEAKRTENPLAVTKRNLRNGEIYYGYYCLQCHGKNGDGDGPVGESYVPKPTDLRSPRIAAMTDGRLYKAMLRGTGHDSAMDGGHVLEQTVPPEHRWPLVMYVRTFSQASPASP